MNRNWALIPTEALVLFFLFDQHRGSLDVLEVVKNVSSTDKSTLVAKDHVVNGRRQSVCKQFCQKLREAMDETYWPVVFCFLCIREFWIDAPEASTVNVVERVDSMQHVSLDHWMQSSVTWMLKIVQEGGK